MKTRLFLAVLTPLISLILQAQVNPANILDTLETESGKVVLYNNFTWQYVGVDPILFDPESDSTRLFADGWTHELVRGNTRITPDSIRDTTLILLAGDRKFSMPVFNEHLIRGFMYTHKGLDIRLQTGDSVRAVFDGVVRYAKYNSGGFGNLVIIRHYNGLESLYGHLSKINVTVNQLVTSGDLIGLGGSTGRSRGPHLHFEIRYQELPIDPRRVIDLDSSMLVSNVLPIKKEVFYPKDWDSTAVYYKIKSGDTLGYLAAKYKSSVREICAMNQIKSTTTLKIGRVLRVR